MHPCTMLRQRSLTEEEHAGGVRTDYCLTSARILIRLWAEINLARQ